MASGKCPLDSGYIRWMKNNASTAALASQAQERRFVTGFGYGSTHDKANDQRCKRLRRLLEEFGEHTDILA
jgi:hypothetical protein